MSVLEQAIGLRHFDSVSVAACCEYMLPVQTVKRAANISINRGILPACTSSSARQKS
ncbi:hypothetical protein KPSA3_03452 [Pseudomonas syringae pv. actinidiae]|uniref:Uncharacterized protein n=1 Tax=Pseudomonas syringae pv. actinidiae TaxID=103796 RepID=A0AAN4Q4M3_PSESF|nr:hypothetical protein KPSA3_03452 [Pseudomonas syringae pv. actinidiae]